MDIKITNSTSQKPGIVGTWVNNNYYSQGYCVFKKFSTYMCWKDSFRRWLKLPNLMEGKFQYQGHLYQDMEEWFSPRGIQYDRCFFSEKEKQESIQIESSYHEGEMISN